MQIIKNKTIREIAKLVTWKDVKKSLKFHHGGKWNHPMYEKLFNRIATCKKQRNSSKEYLEVFASNMEFSSSGIDSYYGIHIKKFGDEMNWSMSFIPWNRLIQMKISDETLDYYTIADIVAHFIYELTWYGSEKDSQKYYKKIISRTRDIVKSTKKL